MEDRRLDMEEREISIMDMLYRICLKWRVILIWMVVFGILMNAVGYLKAKRDITQERYTEEELQSLTAPLTGGEIREAEHAVYVYQDFQRRYENLKKYLNESIRMRVNANCVPTLVLRYKVDTHYEVVYPDIAKRDVTGDVINSLGAELQKDSLYESLVETWREPIELYYLKEMVSYSSSGQLFIITVRGLSEGDCNTIAEAIDQTLKKEKDNIAGLFGNFDLNLLGRTYYEETNSSIFNEQNNQINNLNNLLNSMRNVANNLSNDQANYYEALLTERQAEAVEAGQINEIITKKAEINSSVIRPKWILIGFILGALLAAVGYGFVYILSRKLHLPEESEVYLGIPLLGSVICKKADRKGLDRFFFNLFKGRKRNFSKEESIELACAKLNALSVKNNVKQVFLSDVVMNAASETVSEELKKVLAVAGLSAVYGKAAVYHADSVQKMALCEGAVLLLGTDVSSYEEIQKEKELCLRNGVRILGGIVLEETQ